MLLCHVTLWFFCSGNPCLRMACIEMLAELMSQSQEMANMTKRLEDTTHDTGWKPKELGDSWKDLENIYSVIMPGKGHEGKRQTMDTAPFCSTSSITAAPVQGVFGNLTQSWETAVSLVSASRQADQTLVYNCHSSLLTYQSNSTSAIVCLAQSWHCLTISEVNKSFLFPEHVFLVKRFLEANSSTIKHVDVFCDRQSHFQCHGRSYSIPNTITH